MNNGDVLQVKVWGDMACFTRPEMKVERVSYPVMTPSAARGVLEAIFWKPEFSWQVHEIWALKPIRYQAIMRNEVNSKIAISTTRGWTERGGHYLADNDRAQRHTLALRDVEYIVRAQMSLRPHATDDIAKYRDQFRRRVKRGQYWQTPYLGCREFPAFFGPVNGSEIPHPADENLGLMLLDIIYEEGGEGRGKPRFFEAKLQRGVMAIPQDRYGEEA